MKKNLVTGCSGFIGGHLVRRLLEDKENEVWGVDALLYNQNYTPPKGLKYFPISTEMFFKEHPTEMFDWCFHLGSPASPPWYLKYPLITVHANTTDLELCLQHSKKLLFTSTSEIYGEPLKHPQSETYWGNVDSFCMRSVYDESKRLGETLCYIYGNAVVVRLFNSYGPGMNFNDGRCMINFIKQALKGNLMTIYGDGTQTRSFCYVSDTIDGIMTVMKKAPIREVYNVGNYHEITIRGLVDVVKEVTRSKSKTIYLPLPSHDPTKRCPDCSKLKSLGWKPKISLHMGISIMTKEVRKRLNKGEK
jgi:nucleoside-diphosphate-sugar epimerase